MPSSWISRQAANMITLARIALTPVFVWCVWGAADRGTGSLAAVLYVLIASSDFVDGRVARYFGVISREGRLLDHCADITFLLASFSLYQWLGVVPWWVPAAIATSFAVYVVDSWRLGERDGWPNLVGSRVGHTAGILNYALVGVLVGNETIDLQILPGPLMAAIFWLVPIYSGLAILTRLYAPHNSALPSR